MFTIDAELNISAVEAVPEQIEAGTMVFRSEAELAAIAERMSITKLAEVWNSFAGVVPFDDLKPVAKFETKQAAAKRIWVAVQRLAEPCEARPVAPEATAPALPAAPKQAAKKPAKKPAAKKPAPKPKKATAAAGVEIAKPGSKRAKALERISRKGGATLEQIMAATDSTRQSASNFVNEIGAAITVKKTKNAEGVLVYSRA